MRADPTRLRLASGREEAYQELHDSHPMPWTARGELQKLQKGTPEDDEDSWKSKPWDMQTDSVETQAQEQQPPRKRLLTKKNKVRQQLKQQQHVCKFLTRNRTGLELR